MLCKSMVCCGASGKGGNIWNLSHRGRIKKSWPPKD
jgi:hypothetical protein